MQLNQNKEDNNSFYSQIIKSTSLFGGVQVISILVSIVRTKFVAFLLGTSGVGYLGILQSTIKILSSVSILGLKTSSVRHLAIAKKTNDKQKIDTLIISFGRVITLIGVLISSLVFIFSSQLSILVFNSLEYSYIIRIISFIVFIQTLSSGLLALLQGFNRLKHLAYSTIITSIFSLLLTVPMYYIWGEAAIVPSLVVISILTFLPPLYYAFPILKSVSLKLSIKASFSEGVKLVKLGSVIMTTNLLLLGVMYIVQIYITRYGGPDDLGIYIASNKIIVGYIGLVFSSMLPDYLPRLSAINENIVFANKMVNQQLEIALLLLGPILLILLIFAPLVIQILYSKDFFQSIIIIRYALPGVLFMAVNWATGIMIIAKGDFKLFLLLEIISDIFILVIYILLYKHWGLESLGLAYFFNHLIRFIIQIPIIVNKYSFVFYRFSKKVLITHFVLLLLALITLYCKNLYLKDSLLLLLIIISFVFTYLNFRKKIKIKSFINFLKKK